MIVRKLNREERVMGLEIILEVFMKFEAPDYTEQGIKTFKDFIFNQEKMNNLEMYGAFENNKLIGVIATRESGNHIALFFVDSSFHNQGFGKALFNIVLQNSTADEITVNSSPYAVNVYHHLGFADSDIEQLTDGMRYTPMTYIKKRA